jgi:hypothetical protein
LELHYEPNTTTPIKLQLRRTLVLPYRVSSFSKYPFSLFTFFIIE